MPQPHGPSPQDAAKLDWDDPSSEPADHAQPLDPSDLITRHQRGVWRYLRMLGCDSATADDLTQETFLRVLRREKFVQHSESATASYLRRTAYNLLVSRHRKLGRVQTVAESSVLDEIWNRWAGKDVTGDLAVDALRVVFEWIDRSRKVGLEDEVC